MKYDRSVGKFPQLEAPPGAQAGAGEKREGVRQKLKLLSLQQYNNKHKDKITIRGRMHRCSPSIKYIVHLWNKCENRILTNPLVAGQKSRKADIIETLQDEVQQ